MDTRLEFYEHSFRENLKNPSQFWSVLSEFCGANKIPLQAVEEHDGHTIFEAVAKSRRLQSQSTDRFCQLLHDSGHLLLAKVFSIDPDKVCVGGENWEKILYDWWDDFTEILQFQQLAKVMVHEEVLQNNDVNWIVRNLDDSSDRIGMALCIYAERAPDLDSLQRTLYHIGITTPEVMELARACLPVDPDEYEWILCHRDLFIMSLPDLDPIVEYFSKERILTEKDVSRFDRMSGKLARTKYVINTLQRKTMPTMNGLISVLNNSGYTNLADIFRFQPPHINIQWDVFRLLQQNWSRIVNTVRYEDIMGYLGSAGFLPHRLHLRIRHLGSEAEKMRQILKFAVGSEYFYDAVFHAIGLQPKYEEIFDDSVQMNEEVLRSILETQDFIAQNLLNVEMVVPEMINLGLLIPSDYEFIKRMPTSVQRNMAICNTLKKKSMNAVRKFAQVLWKTQNRDCAEIISIDFLNFHLALDEWSRLKSNWGSITRHVRWDDIRQTALEMELVSAAEVEWIEKSFKNRSRMRKFLRILPRKVDGYRILLVAISLRDSYLPLLLQCQPMDYWQLRSLQDSMEFLIDNTKDLQSLVNVLRVDNVITETEYQLLMCYDKPIQELYMLLVGKDNDVIERLVCALQVTGNFDAAAVLSVDLSSIRMSSAEWQDYQRMWLDFMDELNYLYIRQHLLSSKLINDFEDEKIKNEPDNVCQMRMLLRILPYRFGSLSTLVQLML